MALVVVAVVLRQYDDRTSSIIDAFCMRSHYDFHRQTPCERLMATIARHGLLYRFIRPSGTHMDKHIGLQGSDE